VYKWGRKRSLAPMVLGFFLFKKLKKGRNTIDLLAIRI